MNKFQLTIIIPAFIACGGCNTTTPNAPSATTAPSLQAALYQQYNLSLLRPPSTFYTPGTVARVKIVDPGTTNASGTVVSLSRFCQPGAALPLESIPKSQTTDLSISYDVSRDAAAKAELQSIAQLGASINYIDKVDITLSNPVLYRPDDTQLAAALAAIKQSGCSLEGRKQVTEVLQADVTVKTSVASGANLSLSEAQILQKLVGASFGASASNDDSNVTIGKGLFYGVEVDKVL